jgi:hypothetical protein
MSLMIATRPAVQRISRREDPASTRRSQSPRPSRVSYLQVVREAREEAMPPAGSERRPGPEVAVPKPLRLTRRGRIAVRFCLTLAVLLAVIGGVLLLDRTAEAGSVSHPVPVAYQVVLPGQTLWQIAGEVAPNTDRRDTVAEIVELNALPSADVQVGQRIAIPAGSQ